MAASRVNDQRNENTSEPKTARVPPAGLMPSQQAKPAHWASSPTPWPRVTAQAGSPRGPDRASTAASTTATAPWSSTRPRRRRRQCLSTKSHSPRGCPLRPLHPRPTQSTPAAPGTAPRTQTSPVSSKPWTKTSSTTMPHPWMCLQSSRLHHCPKAKVTISSHFWDTQGDSHCVWAISIVIVMSSWFSRCPG